MARTDKSNNVSATKILLAVSNLCAASGGQEILRGIDLQVRPGEVHAIMGPNGSGKSTLAHVLAGRPGLEVTGGKILIEGQDLTGWSAEERARRGIFLAFQYPVEIPGVGNAHFLRAAVNAVKKSRGKQDLDATEFLRIAKEKVRALGMDNTFLTRTLNDGMSGGEKKRNEMLQFAMLEPRLAILDETDSGLDIDALQAVAHGINLMRSPKRAIILITHYQRLLEYVKPDFVHVLSGGKIVRTGHADLAVELEKTGYAEVAK